jgi:hypothetical protein
MMIQGLAKPYGPVDRLRHHRHVEAIHAGQWLDPAVPLKEKGWQAGLGIDATMSWEDYEFYGEKAPVTVDDPDIVGKTRKKWADKLKWK